MEKPVIYRVTADYCESHQKMLVALQWLASEPLNDELVDGRPIDAAMADCDRYIVMAREAIAKAKGE